LLNDRAEAAAPASELPVANTYHFVPSVRPPKTADTSRRLKPGAVIADDDYELAQAIAFLKSRDTLQAPAAVHALGESEGDVAATAVAGSAANPSLH
jgi:hypothetical protein